MEEKKKQLKFNRKERRNIIKNMFKRNKERVGEVKGAFGKVKNHNTYETLKTLPKSKRMADNCNECGVANINRFKVGE